MNVLRRLKQTISTVPYPEIFLGYLGSLWEGGRGGGSCKPSPVGSRGKAPENLGYFTFWIAQNIALAALNGHLSIFRWINFYTLESLGIWFWDPKPVCWLQNSSGYDTAAYRVHQVTQNLLVCWSCTNFL